MNTKEFGRRVFLSRYDLKMKQEELARRVGVSRSYISNLENGRITNPTIDVVLGVAKALGVSAAYLLCLTDNPLEHETEEAIIREGRVMYEIEVGEDAQIYQELVDIVHKLSPENRELLRQVAMRLGLADEAKVMGAMSAEGEEENPPIRSVASNEAA